MMMMMMMVMMVVSMFIVSGRHEVRVRVVVLLAELDVVDVDITVNPEEVNLVIGHPMVKVAQMRSVHMHSIGVWLHMNRYTKRVAFVDVVAVPVLTAPVLVVARVQHNHIRVHSR